jgi:RNA polymerase sigma-70 factor (ECF subfamily)
MARNELLVNQNARDRQDDDIKRVAQRSKNQAYEMLVCRYRKRLLWHVAGIVKDMEAAEDLVNETFIRAMGEQRLFNEEFRIKPWLYRVASNVAFNHVRNRKRREEILEQRQKELQATTKVDYGAQRLREQWWKMIQPRIQRLSSDHQKVLHLRFWEELSYEEMSQRLCVPQGTIMSRLSRAKKLLMKLLVRDGLDARRFAIVT